MATLGLVLLAVVSSRGGRFALPIALVIVSGHSMEPTLHTGDLLVVVRARRYRRGDVLAYRVPKGDIGGGLIVIHRRVAGDNRDGFVMRGDNKPFNDPWRPRPSDVVGRLRLAVPKVGLGPGYVRTPLCLALMAAVVAGFLALGPRQTTGS